MSGTGPPYVAQAGFELNDLPVSDTQMLGLQVGVTGLSLGESIHV